MHLIRRSAVRALASPSTSFVFKSRSITTSSPFTARSKFQSSAQPLLRRFASNDVDHEQESASSMSGYDESGFLSPDESAADSAIDSASTNSAPRYSTQRRYSSEDAFDGRDVSYRTPPRSPSKKFTFTPSPDVYIGNLPFEIAEDTIQEEFSEFGKIKQIRIARDEKGYSKGFAHIQFSSIDEAAAAVKAKDQCMIGGRRAIVNYTARSTYNPATRDPTATLYVGNLAFEMSDADLNTLFRPVKNVTDVRVAIDRRTGQPRGFAHADFVDIKSAIAGSEYLKEQELFGRKLRIDYAEPREGWSGRGQPGARSIMRDDQDS